MCLNKFFGDLYTLFTEIYLFGCVQIQLDELMESKSGNKKSSSKSLFYEAPLGYSIEDIRPNGGIKKFRSAAYSNVSFNFCFVMFCFQYGFRCEHFDGYKVK